MAFEFTEFLAGERIPQEDNVIAVRAAGEDAAVGTESERRFGKVVAFLLVAFENAKPISGGEFQYYGGLPPPKDEGAPTR